MPRERRHYRKSFLLAMDPDCGICHYPADADCGCEAKFLDTVIKQAEQRMMHAMYMEIRSWVRQHAQDYVLSYFQQLSDRRKAAHQQHVESISAYVFRHYGAPPHPNDTAAAEAELKHGIDQDWQRCIQRYPEVSEYFFSLVDVTLPTENDPSVKDLPPTRLPIPRKVNRRSRSRPPAAITNESTHNGSQEGPPRITRGRTPPAIEARRTPGPPPETRHFRVPPPPGSAYKGHYAQYPG